MKKIYQFAVVTESDSVEAISSDAKEMLIEAEDDFVSPVTKSVSVTMPIIVGGKIEPLPVDDESERLEAENAPGLCGCGKPNRYEVADGEMACNKMVRCLSRDEALAELSALRRKVAERDEINEQFRRALKAIRDENFFYADLMDAEGSVKEVLKKIARKTLELWETAELSAALDSAGRAQGREES